MRRKVLQTIREYRMIEKGDHVLVGFSGGADSTALLMLLWQLREQLGITVSACHLNHLLRGEEAERDEAFVRAFCRQRGIPLLVVRADVKAGAAAAGQSVETYARKLRYQVFAAAAENRESLLHGDCPDLPPGSSAVFWEGGAAQIVKPRSDGNPEDFTGGAGPEPDRRGREATSCSNFTCKIAAEHPCPDQAGTSNPEIPAGNSCPTADHRGREATSCSNLEISTGNFKIATAHTLSDNAETLLFYLARGAGLNGLGGIPPVRGNIIRPLVGCTRGEIEQFCAEQGLCFVHDSSNDSDDYTRNYIRHRLLPLMQELNPAFLQGTGRLCRMAREENDLLHRQTEEALEQLTVKHQPLTLLRGRFLQLHPALQRRVLLQLLLQAQLPPDFDRVEQMQRRAALGKGKTELRRGVALCADRERIWLDCAVFYPKEHTPYFERPFAEGVTELFPGKSVEVRICDLQEYKLFLKKDPSILKNAIDCDKMKDIAVFRQRREGDRMTVYRKSGAAGSRPLKKMWNEAKLPQAERWRAVVLGDSSGVLWVEGFGCDRHAAPDGQSRRIALIRVKQTQAL